VVDYMGDYIDVYDILQSKEDKSPCRFITKGARPPRAQ
jgi:hypothetical protein